MEDTKLSREKSRELAFRVYKILTNKKFRNGPLAPEYRKKIILDNLEDKISRKIGIWDF
jgi:hypothetical protein